ncbi:helix-turn-helix transcriptional regulator [Zunongwangia sp. SCSIO 43204]|uniref:helix-turn-helix domain-containing protein n=1 Tax=Zunongwangia sp. SCSIO 43204 TaxID=2779359 RepID=UPI001CA7FFD6|nr:helix-turn-helix transcriptional regulator [Zunongwangia sp. SCSIO 43204]UAB85600.1 helix-turn-helix transcriptional regulator [Zunongwangia sp. SCSIO 43204]
MASKIETYIISKVKEKRKEKGFSQIALSQKLGLSDSFISHVESQTRRAKYNLNHLNELAIILECSPKDFWPEKGIK